MRNRPGFLFENVECGIWNFGFGILQMLDFGFMILDLSQFIHYCLYLFPRNVINLQRIKSQIRIPKFQMHS